MSYAFVFWFLIFFYLLFFGAWRWQGSGWAWGPWGNSGFLLVLIVVLGLQVFGVPVHR